MNLETGVAAVRSCLPTTGHTRTRRSAARALRMTTRMTAGRCVHFCLKAALSLPCASCLWYQHEVVVARGCIRKAAPQVLPPAAEVSGTVVADQQSRDCRPVDVCDKARCRQLLALEEVCIAKIWNMSQGLALHAGSSADRARPDAHLTAGPPHRPAPCRRDRLPQGATSWQLSSFPASVTPAS